MDIPTVLIASGSGTDANSVMAAYRAGQLVTECKLRALLSTRENAGCLEKAASHQISTRTIAKKGMDQFAFNHAVREWLKETEAKLVFLLGCIHMIPRIAGVYMFNIHPAHTVDHGGKGMYGLNPHEHVLAQIVDQIVRGHRQVTDRFFSFPTVHEATPEYDQGQPLLTAQVQIPGRIIELALANPGNLEEAASQLQQLVLPMEHLMLPAAVNLACRRIITLEG